MALLRKLARQQRVNRSICKHNNCKSKRFKTFSNATFNREELTPKTFENATFNHEELTP